jgi:hypothetical protein
MSYDRKITFMHKHDEGVSNSTMLMSYYREITFMHKHDEGVSNSTKLMSYYSEITFMHKHNEGVSDSSLKHDREYYMNRWVDFCCCNIT